MIGYIKGTVTEIYPDYILLECNSIGYRIFVTSSLISELSYDDEIRLYTYLSVREDSLTLFGFKKRDELEAYKLLLTVNGVGPKAAMGIMSSVGEDELRYCVLTSDAKKLSKAQGIGAKTAQKIILELKDKFDFRDMFSDDNERSTVSYKESTGAVADTVSALEALGYAASDALKAVRKAAENNSDADSGELLKEALKFML